MICCRHVVAVGLTLLLLQVTATGAERKPTKYVRFQVGDVVSYGVVEGDRVRQLSGDLFQQPTTTEETYALSEVRLLVPTRPTKILASAGNYKSHMAGQATHAAPEFFFKPPSCLVASGENIVIPKGTGVVHPEGELVIVIGKRAKDVSADQALDYVLGVTCGNDVSARDWQKADIQWWRAKGSDSFGPCGPFVVAGIDYNNLQLRCRVNGQIRQETRTSELVHGVAALVSYASKFVTLEPGDLIYTGTPGTTQAIQAGDVVEVELEGVGVLRNPVTAK